MNEFLVNEPLVLSLGTMMKAVCAIGVKLGAALLYAMLIDIRSWHFKVRIHVHTYFARTHARRPSPDIFAFDCVHLGFRWCIGVCVCMPEETVLYTTNIDRRGREKSRNRIIFLVEKRRTEIWHTNIEHRLHISLDVGYVLNRKFPTNKNVRKSEYSTWIVSKWFAIESSSEIAKTFFFLGRRYNNSISHLCPESEAKRNAIFTEVERKRYVHAYPHIRSENTHEIGSIGSIVWHCVCMRVSSNGIYSVLGICAANW